MELKQNGSTIHVVHIFSGDLWAGAEVMIYHLLYQLRNAEQIRTTAICLNDGILAKKLRDARIITHIVDESRLSFTGILMRIRNILKDQNVHIVHSHRNKENLLAALFRIIAGKAKLVTTIHGLPEHGKNLKGKISKALNFRTQKLLFDRIVAVSSDIQNSLLIQYQFRPDQIVVLRNGIPLPVVEGGFNAPHGQNLHIGTVGRMVPVKDFALFVEAAALLCKQLRQNIRFSILGDGPLKKVLWEKVCALSLQDKIIFLPLLEDPSSYYRSLDIYLNTSKHEGIPLSILEAMSYEKAVIAPNVGGIPEIIRTGVDGLLVNERSAEAFASACASLVNDAGYRAKLGHQARKRVEDDFSASGMATRYIDLYQSLMPHRYD